MPIGAGLKSRIKHVLSFIPTPFWTRRYPHLNRLEKWKVGVLCDILWKESGGMVFSGPFSTMKLPAGLALSQDPRMIVGSYEEEVRGIVNEVIASAPSQIVDIGSAYGYYAVGFALKIAKTRVTAFEAVESEHWKQLADLAAANGVSGRIVQRGLCTPADLAAVCEEGAFVLSDCEGAEEDLCDPSKVPALKSCTILIELHEFHRPLLVARLVERFKNSHSIRTIEEQRRDPARYRILKRLPKGWRSIAIEEAKWIDEGTQKTTCLRFMLLTPKLRAPGHVANAD